MADSIETPQVMPIEDAFAIIGIKMEETDPQSVLSNFFKIWNDGADDKKALIAAKNLIMQKMVSDQMKAQRYFEIVSPFPNSCISCRGTGEIYKFNKKPVLVNCHICAGKKKLTVKCRKCKGSGRYIERWPEGGGMNLKCTACKGKGSVRVKCSNCFGKGKIKKIVPDHSIKSTTPCKHCKELGFIVPKAPKAKRKKRTEPISNPVISPEHAAALSDMIKS